MIDKNELCEKIINIYPDIGQCGIEVQVEYDESQSLGIEIAQLRGNLERM